MTPKRKRFVEEYLIDLNAARAYRDAGYRGNDNVCAVEGHRLLSDPKIAAEIAAAQAERAQRTKIDADWVLLRARELHDKALEAKAYSVAKGALDLIGKHVEVQAFREQVQHSGVIEYKNLSDEEIAARIAAHEAQRASRPTSH